MRWPFGLTSRGGICRHGADQRRWEGGGLPSSPLTLRSAGSPLAPSRVGSIPSQTITRSGSPLSPMTDPLLCMDADRSVPLPCPARRLDGSTPSPASSAAGSPGRPLTDPPPVWSVGFFPGTGDGTQRRQLMGWDRLMGWHKWPSLPDGLVFSSGAAAP